MTRLGKQHKREATPTNSKPEETPTLTPGYRIPLTPAALLRWTKDRRQAMGMELKDQMTLIHEALSQEPAGTPEEECELHA